MDETTQRPPDAGAVLPLGREQIVDWAAAFSADGRMRWEDCIRLADRFWMTPEDPDRHVAWHHLLMAVGNFKRQSPIHLSGLLVPLLDTSSPRPAEVAVPPGQSRLSRDTRQTWSTLTDIRGIGIATATTLMSALWPGTHVIIDRRAWTAAVGLQASEGLTTGQATPDGRKRLPDITWEDYGDYLAWVQATAGANAIEPRAVERTLYVLGNEPESASRSWKEYGARLRTRRPPV